MPRASEKAHRHLLVLANPVAESFDHALAAAYAEVARSYRQEVVVRDLNALGFDPVLKAAERPGPSSLKLAPDVEAEIAEIAASDAIVLVYPIWFGGPPAILKGYVDRVFGAAYTFRQFRDGVGQPHLKGKLLVSITTSGTSIPWLGERGQVISLRQGFDVYLERGFGMHDSEHISIDNVVPNLSERYAAEQLERVRDVAKQTCAKLFERARLRDGFTQGTRHEAAQ